MSAPRVTVFPSVAALSLLLSVAARADEAPPPNLRRPAKPIPVEQPKPAPAGTKPQLVIEAREDVNESILVIPASLAAGRNANPAAPGAAAPARPGPMRLALAGLALSAALGFGGLWLARRGRAGSGVKATVIVAALLGLGGGVAVWADVGPRMAPNPEPVPVPVPAGVTLTGPVIVQIDPKATDVKLIVNSKMLAKLAAEPAKKP